MITYGKSIPKVTVRPYDWRLADDYDIWDGISLDTSFPIYMMFTTGDNWIFVGSSSDGTLMAHITRDETDLLVHKGLKSRLYTLKATDIETAKEESRTYFDDFWQNSVHTNYIEV